MRRYPEWAALAGFVVVALLATVALLAAAGALWWLACGGWPVVVGLWWLACGGWPGVAPSG